MIHLLILIEIHLKYKLAIFSRFHLKHIFALLRYFLFESKLDLKWAVYWPNMFRFSLNISYSQITSSRNKSSCQLPCQQLQSIDKRNIGCVEWPWHPYQFYSGRRTWQMCPLFLMYTRDYNKGLTFCLDWYSKAYT